MALSLLIMDVEDYIKEANRQISHMSGIAHQKIKAIINSYKELNYKELKLNYYYEKTISYLTRQKKLMIQGVLTLVL